MSSRLYLLSSSWNFDALTDALSHEFPMLVAWLSHETPMLLPCSSHETPMLSRCFPHESSLIPFFCSMNPVFCFMIVGFSSITELFSFNLRFVMMFFL